MNKYVKENLIIATFSIDGPFKCSGLEIKQNDERSLTETFIDEFELIKYHFEDHKTPFDTLQNFIYTLFVKK